ncbi:hypothetical protein [Pseudonocardia endophytica]|uniref:Uncharacterized protein n=1 Tax=Pseudonocardia endophytica TaxID=401976 RepID=A0A4V2PIL8_PSEEN|nr:hypothetical protein [Pseudonocardia endophytica]TCK25216.1 hypothetical protein EV378_1016 [Pseudonocardia endophytica]
MDGRVAEPSPGEGTSIEPGDFVLGVARGHRKHQLIKLVQGARLAPEHRRYAGYTHAALVVSADGDLLEAFGQGMRLSHLDDLAMRPHQVVHVTASPEVRERVVAIGLHAFAGRARYNALAIVSTALTSATGRPVSLSVAGTHTCSGLVAHALLAAGAVYDVDAALVTPAQLAIHFGAPQPPPEDPSPACRTRRSVGRPAVTAP